MIRKTGCILFSVLFLFWYTGCKQDNTISSSLKPAISSITPASVVKGQSNVDGRITGSNFAGTVAVDLGPGLSLINTQVLSITEVKVVFNVAADAAPGPRSISIATAAGKTTADALLTVSDNRPPVAAFNASSTNAFRNEVITFDGAPSNDPDGRITKFDWDFGDGGSAQGESVQHKFDSAGNFQVTLVVTDNHDSTSTTSKGVHVENAIPPVAHYNYTPHSGFVTTMFEFDGSPSTDADGRVVRYIWDFGDGEQVQGKLVHHKFANTKDFKVKLTVFDNDDLQSFVEKFVEIKGAIPVARFDVSPRSGDTSTNFRFDASSSNDIDGSIRSYDWKFGDGNTGSGKIVSHKYDNAGHFNVQLTVTDNGNLHSSDDRDVTVSEGGGGGGGGGGVEVEAGAEIQTSAVEQTSKVSLSGL